VAFTLPGIRQQGLARHHHGRLNPKRIVAAGECYRNRARAADCQKADSGVTHLAVMTATKFGDVVRCHGLLVTMVWEWRRVSGAEAGRAIIGAATLPV
jgi:hypothetical protein